MKKSTKGALAAGSAAVLLMGGAGTLAYWTDNAAVDGVSIETGNLAITGDDCGDWMLDLGRTGEAVYGAQLLVPGDDLTITCTYTVEAAGEHLSATLSTPDAVASGTLTTATVVSLPVTTTYTLDGAPLTSPTTITSDDDGGALVATIKVSFPYGTADSTPTAADGTNGNDTQNKAATLDALSVTLVQENHA